MAGEGPWRRGPTGAPPAPLLRLLVLLLLPLLSLLRRSAALQTRSEQANAQAARCAALGRHPPANAPAAELANRTDLAAGCGPCKPFYGGGGREGRCWHFTFQPDSFARDSKALNPLPESLDALSVGAFVDLNEDGVLDLLVFATESAKVFPPIRKKRRHSAVFLASRVNGAVTFKEEADGYFDLGLSRKEEQSVVAATVADIDGDGNSDLVLLTENGSLALLQGTGATDWLVSGNGDPPFKPANIAALANLTAQVPELASVAFGHVGHTKDSNLAAITVSVRGELDFWRMSRDSISDGAPLEFVREPRSDGPFSANTRLATTSKRNLWHVSLSDADGDGDLDLIVNEPATHSSLTFYENRDGYFIADISMVPAVLKDGQIQSDFRPAFMSLVSDPPLKDLVGIGTGISLSDSFGSIWVARQSSTLSLDKFTLMVDTAALTPLTGHAFEQVKSFFLGDLDGDLRPDLVFANKTDLTAFKNTGNPAQRFIPFDDADRAFQVDSLDFEPIDVQGQDRDKDGILDLILLHDEDFQMVILSRDTPRTPFKEIQPFELCEGDDTARRRLSQDLGGDTEQLRAAAVGAVLEDGLVQISPFLYGAFPSIMGSQDLSCGAALFANSSSDHLDDKRPVHLVFWKALGVVDHSVLVAGLTVSKDDQIETFSFDIDRDNYDDIFLRVRSGKGLASSASLIHYSSGDVNHDYLFEQSPLDAIVMPEWPLHGQPPVLRLADLDEDGDLDILALVPGSGQQPAELRNSAVECMGKCTLNRGWCADSARSDDAIFRLAALHQTLLDDKEVVVGACACLPQFTGLSCEQCHPTRYGKDCDLECPQFSETNLTPTELVFPFGPSVDDCHCTTTFVRVSGKPSAGGAERGREDDLGPSFQCGCPAGTELDDQLSLCQPCEEGFYKEADSVEPCTKCPPNTTTFGSNRLECVKHSCPAGSQRGDDVATCLPCKTGSYRSEEDSSCLACPQVTPATLSEGSVSISNCTTGSGSLMANGLAISCSEPDFLGALICDKTGVTLEEVPIMAGFWRSAITSLEIFPCPELEYCQPAKGLPREPKLKPPPGRQSEEDKFDGTAGDTLCSPHHTGVLCATCTAGYGMAAKRCLECASADIDATPRFRLMVVMAAVVLGSPALYVFFLSRSSQSSATPEGGQDICAWRFCQKCLPLRSIGALVDELGTRVRILLGFFQVLISYLRAFHLLDEFALTIPSLFTNLDVGTVVRNLSLGCVFRPDFYSALLLYTLAPIAAIGAVSMVLVVQLPCRAPGFARALGFAVWISFQIMFLVYPGIGTVLLQAFMPRSFPAYDGDPSPLRSLRDDVSIDFDSERSTSWRIYAGAMILVYPVGILVVFASGINFRTKYALAGSGSEFSDAVYKAIRFLTRPYHKRLPWFECYELARKLLLTSVISLIRQVGEPLARTAFGAMLAAFYVALQALNPYVETSDHVFASLSLLLLLALYFGTTVDVRSDVLVLVVAGLELVGFTLLLVRDWPGAVHRVAAPFSPRKRRELQDGSVEPSSPGHSFWRLFSPKSARSGPGSFSAGSASRPNAPMLDSSSALRNRRNRGFNAGQDVEMASRDNPARKAPPAAENRGVGRASSIQSHAAAVRSERPSAVSGCSEDQASVTLPAEAMAASATTPALASEGATAASEETTPNEVQIA